MGTREGAKMEDVDNGFSNSKGLKKIQRVRQL